MNYAIEIKDLYFAYERDVNVLKGVNLNIKKGSYTVVLGHNGSGKSTLAKLIVGLINKKSGSIKVNGVELDEKTIYSIRDQVGIVFQNPDNQFIGATVEDDIAFGLENHCVEQEKMKDIIYSYAEKVGMDRYLDKEPGHLSGGQKQRVAIAGVLAMTPQIVIFDESTSMLDPKGKREIKELILKMREEYQDMTVLSISHDIDEALLADEVVILNEGQIYAQGKAEDVFTKYGELENIQLDLPFIYKLEKELKKNNFETKENINDSKALENDIVEFKNTQYIYMPKTPFEHLALNDVSLGIKEGSFTAIVGHTGSGKSTLIQHINALLIPTDGEVNVGEYKILKDSKVKGIKNLRKKAGLVFQFPEYQLFEETIEKDIAFGPKNFGAKDEELKDKIKDIIKLVGLDESYLTKSPFELSGGQKRRVAIAGVLAMDPDILVLDEPTAGLDPQGTKEMMQLFKKLNELGKTIVLVTHELDLVLENCEDVIVMQEGKNVAQGRPSDLFFKKDLMDSIGLEAPNVVTYANDLIAQGVALDTNSIKDIESLARSIAMAKRGA